MIYSDNLLEQHRIRKSLGCTFRERVVDFYREPKTNCLTQAQQNAIDKGTVINTKKVICGYTEPLGFWKPIQKI